MLLLLETTTGLLTPAGVAPAIPRGGLTPVYLQFLTNSVAGLLAGGPPIAVKFYAPEDLGTPLTTLNVFIVIAAESAYLGQLDTLGGGLAYLTRGTLVAKISYGAVNVDSQNFLVNYGTPGTGSGAAHVPVVITQAPGSAAIGTFSGKVLTNQVEGGWRAKVAAVVTGFILGCQSADTTDDLTIEAVVNGVPSGKTATLANGSKVQSVAFGTPLGLVAGDLLQFRATAIGAGKRTNLTVQGLFA